MGMVMAMMAHGFNDEMGWNYEYPIELCLYAVFHDLFTVRAGFP